MVTHYIENVKGKSAKRAKKQAAHWGHLLKTAPGAAYVEGGALSPAS